MWMYPDDKDDIIELSKCQSVAMADCIVPYHQLTDDYGPNLVKTYNSVDSVISALVDDWEIVKGTIANLRGQIEDLQEEIREAEPATPVSLVVSLRNLTKELEDALDRKKRVEIERIKETTPRPACSCIGEHIKSDFTRA